MKIFKVNDCDWIAAETPEQALECLRQHVGDEDVDAWLEDFGQPVELTAEDLDAHTFHDGDDGDERTFREELQRRIDEGDAFPQFFASTEY